MSLTRSTIKYLFFFLILGHAVFAQDFQLDDFVSELSTRQSKVEEFKYIKKIATDLGIKHVYMFGGTAAAWGHYVRWDMRRELGVEKLQPQRFDYDYTNIFRANQDFDVVIDGTVEQAEALESAVQKHFNYFSGPRSTWEVRLLNEQRADKDPIMGDDFQNQHTDSHSTGLIEMMDCEGFDCVKDVRDIENPQSAFLMDMFEAKLHYYFSKDHKGTKRFKAGMNPEILSVVRYFTKAVQYELERRPEDIKLLQKMINDFNPAEKSSWDGYVTRWLEKNAKKLIVNAVDMEFAQSLIEETGLKKKLMALGNPEIEDSMAWWMNKEALKSTKIGEGDGRTAAELFTPNENGDIIVAHETNSFAAFESITKAHDGSANVLASRKGVAGETAVYGDGHYTRLGRKGARGTGLTIRYVLSPQARVGRDFEVSGEFVIIKNRSAVKVIYEKININAKDFYDLVLSGFEFDHNDKGVLEKLRRRTGREIIKLKVSERQAILKKIENKVNKKTLSSEAFMFIFSQEWLTKEVGFWDSLISRNLKNKKYFLAIGYVLLNENTIKNINKWEEYALAFIDNDRYRADFIQLLLLREEFMKKEGLWMRYARLFLRDPNSSSTRDSSFRRAYYVTSVLTSNTLLSKPKLWKKAATLLLTLNINPMSFWAVVMSNSVIRLRIWNEWKEMVFMLINHGFDPETIGISILGGDKWKQSQIQDWMDLMRAFIDRGVKLDVVASHALMNKKLIISNENWLTIAKYFIDKVNTEYTEYLDHYSYKDVKEKYSQLFVPQVIKKAKIVPNINKNGLSLAFRNLCNKLFMKKNL